MGHFKRYTEEQEAKIEALRSQNEKESKSNRSWMKRLKEMDKTSVNHSIGVDDRVFVTIGSSTIIGYITEKTDKTFTVSTPHGVMKNVELQYLRKRYYEDLSHVVIPEELKSETTQTLLSEIRFRRNYYEYDDYRSRLSKFSEDEIKAELRLRPHIRKGGKNQRTVKKYSK